MKKRLLIFVLLLVLVPITSFAGNINVLVDNSKVNFLSDPIIKNGTTLVPMRQIFEALGAKVEWVPESKQVKANLNSTTIILTIGSNTAQVSGSNVKLSACPEIINGNTYVPPRFIAESLGAKVEWDNQTKTVVITTKNKDYSNWVPYSTSNLKTLWSNIMSGDVVYYNGQYLASPSFVQSLSKALDEWNANNQAPPVNLIPPDFVFVPAE
ncbi:copper amine oxidase N-terminal domain-containing protein [Aminipila terrae]|uniref:Copper amine oxidase-like N-terminal domain-containing protein n=1 Tax=Aminipila terrae TaxID=2697030 RepID=A0A6P1MFT8_9FIRM|nr:copper amine oxidase N-terminal domain-containing protein [Aminipila terrae]QHI72912.1 hypothetical protein Ami3637_11300 [Aminipila terrae]